MPVDEVIGTIYGPMVLAKERVQGGSIQASPNVCGGGVDWKDDLFMHTRAAWVNVTSHWN